MGKQHRHSFNESRTRATELIELVHSDLCGPIEVESFRGSRYLLTFICDKSRRIFVYFIEFKSEVYDKFLEFKAMVEKQTGRKIKRLRTDNGGEYKNDKFKQFFKKSGILHETTCPYTPEQNGVAERWNRSIMEKTRCLLHDSGLEKKFWAEAVNCAVYLLNRSPVSGSNVTPEEIWSGQKPNLSHLRIFGTLVTVHIPKQKRRKLDMKAIEAIFVGYGTQTKGYRLFNPETNEVFYSRDVTFLNEGTRVHQQSEVVKKHFISIEFSQQQENHEDDEVILTDDEDEAHLSLNQQNIGIKGSKKPKTVVNPDNLRRSERIKQQQDSQASSNLVQNEHSNVDLCSVMLGFQNKSTDCGTKLASSNSLQNGGGRDFQREFNSNFLNKNKYLLNESQQQTNDSFNDSDDNEIHL